MLQKDGHAGISRRFINEGGASVEVGHDTPFTIFALPVSKLCSASFHQDTNEQTNKCGWQQL